MVSPIHLMHSGVNHPFSWPVPASVLLRISRNLLQNSASSWDTNICSYDLCPYRWRVCFQLTLNSLWSEILFLHYFHFRDHLRIPNRNIHTCPWHTPVQYKQLFLDTHPQLQWLWKDFQKHFNQLLKYFVLQKFRNSLNYMRERLKFFFFYLFINLYNERRKMREHAWRAELTMAIESVILSVNNFSW